MSDDDRRERARARREQAREREYERTKEARDEALATTRRAASERADFAAACVPWGWIIDGDALVGPAVIGGLAVASLVAAADDWIYALTAIPPAATFAIALVIAFAIIAIPFYVRMLAAPFAGSAVEAEQQWFASLPYRLDGVPDALLSTRHKLRFDVFLASDAAGDPQHRADVLAKHASLDATVSLQHARHLRIEIPVDREKRSWKRARGSLLLLHDVVDDVLRPFAIDFPIEHVEVSN